LVLIFLNSLIYTDTNISLFAGPLLIPF